MSDLTLFHTAEAHRTTFDTLAARIAPQARLTHVVRPDWLKRAQDGLDDDLSGEIHRTIAAAANALCTCTTIGDAAQKAGALRIDWPMMQQAARSGGPVLLAYCLESTRAPSSTLLQRAFAEAGQEAQTDDLPLTDLWPLFEADPPAFARQIATRILTALDRRPDIACVVLAQASMAGAAALIQTRVPVLTSPELALREALGLGE